MASAHIRHEARIQAVRRFSHADDPARLRVLLSRFRSLDLAV